MAGHVYHKKLVDQYGQPYKQGSDLIIRSEEVRNVNDTMTFLINGRGLDKMDWIGSSDPYLQFFRLLADQSWALVHTTEVILDNLNPSFTRFTVPLTHLCGGDHHRPVKIKCWDHDRIGSHDFIGETTVTVAEMLAVGPAPAGLERDLINEEKKIRRANKGKPYANSGVLRFVVTLNKDYTFLDYIAGGCHMTLMMAVDYTGSNGDPRVPQSLHYQQSPGGNQYQRAISTIGQILAPYASSTMYPAMGFGGSIGGQATNHCFPLTLNWQQFECDGIAGVLKAYSDSFSKVHNRDQCGSVCVASAS